jgi:DNA invertase Pin-like site-specific DNA recombinase
MMMTKGDHRLLDGYIRVSVVGEREGESFISPKAQRDQIEAWAKLRGVTIANWEEDLDQSGGKLSRPGLDRIMERIRSGETEGLCVARLDRLSRAGVAEALTLIEEILDHGATLAAIDLGLDPTTEVGEFALTIMLALARMERRRITANWDTANRMAIERGIHFTATVPYGYRRRDDKRLEPIPELVPVVNEIFERRTAKASRWSIAKWLNENHPRPDGRDWTARTVEVVIANPVYLGQARHGKHTNDDAHDPIVTPTLFAEANAVKGGSGRTSQEDPALLAGLVRCAGCRYAMRRTFNVRPDGSRVVVLDCTRKYSGGVCKEPAMIVAHRIEPFVAIHTLVRAGNARWAEDAPGDEELREAESAVEHAEARLGTFLGDDDLRQRIAREQFLAEADRRQADVDQAKAKLAEVRATHARQRRREHNLWDEWPDMSRQEQGDYLRMVLDAVYVKKGRGAPDDRVMIVMDGDNDFVVPKRGRKGYKVKPIPWPTEPGDAHYGDVPANAIKAGVPPAIEAAMALGGAPSCDLSDRPKTIEQIDAEVAREVLDAAQGGNPSERVGTMDAA